MRPAKADSSSLFIDDNQTIKVFHPVKSLKNSEKYSYIDFMGSRVHSPYTNKSLIRPPRAARGLSACWTRMFYGAYRP